MKEASNPAGQTYGRWLVLSTEGKLNRHLYWNCLCDCGTKRAVRATSLRKGLSVSCGCLNAEKHSHSMREHGQASSRRGIATAEYFAWQGMIQRTTNPNYPGYENWGGRGVRIEDPRWFDFASFFEDMGKRPQGTSLHRKDNDKGYQKDNCMWAPGSVQGQNQRKRTGTSSQYLGVFRNRNKWMTTIRIHGEKVYLGRFSVEEAAARAYDAAVLQHYGPNAGAKFNFPKEVQNAFTNTSVLSVAA